MALTVLFSAGI